MKQLYKCLNFTLKHLAPDYCSLCAKRSDTDFNLCQNCLTGLPRIPSSCPRCAFIGTGGRPCGRCQTRVPCFDRSLAACAYSDPVTGLVHRLKFGGDLTIARLMGTLLAARVRRESEAALPEVVVPVPLHPLKIARRGFNQSVEIARVAARQLDLPVHTGLVRRRRNTPSQRTLPLKARRGNVKDCFEVTRPPGVRRIALVDDVMTSGATLDALAAALRLAGDFEIQCWVFARA